MQKKRTTKPSHFTQTEFQNLGITILQYNLIKRFCCGNLLTLRAYKSVRAGINLHSILDKDILKNTFNKELRVSFLNKHQISHSNISFTSLKPTRSGDNTKQFKAVMNNLDKIKGKNIILNLYSETGEQALMGTAYIAEQLMAHKFQLRVSNGIEINQLSTDFDKELDIDLLDKDVLIIQAFNAIMTTEYKTQFIENILTSAKIKQVPVIISSNKEFAHKQFKVINLRLTDEHKNQAELIKELFED